MSSIVSRNKNFIFVHVPKTGGSSITKVLREYEASLSFKNNTRRLAKKYLPTKIRRQLLRLIVKRGTIGQYRYLTDRKGQLIVDFVGWYERLEEDFLYICEKIDVDFHMPHVNKSERDNYQNYYDDESREMLAKLSRKDIELFDYSF